MGVFNYEKDNQGIVTVTMDMSGPVNAINAAYMIGNVEACHGIGHFVLKSEPGIARVKEVRVLRID